MAWKQVESYNLGYSIPKNQFYFYYTLVGDSVTYQFFPSPEVFHALAYMFETESPINFNTDGKYFVSAAAEVGDEETMP
jgi:hypothetical protein